MSTINRTLVLNPVEPAPISLKLPTGIETQVHITYTRQDGAPYASDTSSQLYLIARSDRRVLNYPLLSLDPINGQSRAVIPAGDIKDQNGYNVQIIGTVDAEPRLIAKGSASVEPTEALGVIPADMIDTIDLMFNYDEPVELDVTLWKDAGKGAPYDLTAEATTVSAYIYNRKAGDVLMPFLVTVLASNKVRLSLTKEQVNALPATCWWTLSASTAAGLVTLCEGTVTTTGTVTPELPVSTFNYDYQKPNTGDPTAGQIIHANYIQDELKIAKLDSDAEDRTDVLRLVRTGDTITIGVTVWTVTEFYSEGASYFTFEVAPVQQAAITGVTAVTFERP
jgi:hypothetical protein